MKKFFQLFLMSILLSIALLSVGSHAYASPATTWNLVDNQVVDGGVLNVSGSTESTQTVHLSVNGRDYTANPTSGTYQFENIPVAHGENQVQLTVEDTTLGPIHVYSFGVPHTGSNYIVISKSDMRLFYIENAVVVYKFPIAIGTPRTPTPTGSFIIGKMLLSDPNGPWGARRMMLFSEGVSKVPVRVGRRNNGRTHHKAVRHSHGRRQVRSRTRRTRGGRSHRDTVYQYTSGFGYHGYNVHGTDRPDSIGTMASQGCVRLYNNDVIALFNKVNVGTEVYIID